MSIVDEATNAKVKVMQAAMMGKTVQRRPRGCIAWIDDPSPQWSWGLMEYRIKREPREWCLNVNPATGLPQWVPWQPGMTGLGIHVREVVQP